MRGVGVSAVRTRARRESGDDYELINVGDVMSEQAAVRGTALDRSEPSELSVREIGRLRRRAGEYVADRAESCEVLLSTRLAVERGVVARTPVVDGGRRRSESVRARGGRRRTTRRRPLASTVDFRLDMHRAAATAYAIRTDGPVRLLENTGGTADAAAHLVATVS